MPPTPSQSYSTALPPPVAEGGLKRRSPSTVKHIIHTATEHSSSIPLPTLQLKRRSSATLPGATHIFTQHSYSAPLPTPVAEGWLKSYSIPLPTLQLKRRSSATLPGATHIFTQHSYSAPLPTPVAEGGLKRRSPSTLVHIIHTATELFHTIRCHPHLHKATPLPSQLCR